MLIDPTPFTAETFNALIEAQHCFVASLIAVLPRAQRQVLAQELTAQANRVGQYSHPLAPQLLKEWAQRARQNGEQLRER